MSSLTLHAEPLAQSVQLTDIELVVNLVDGRVLSTPLVWFPRLLAASPDERKHYELLGNGEGIHWPDVDEDISVAGLLAGNSSVEYRN
ncbi:MAG: DUF2442 domain-containing protein [Pseudomonadota bacterium]